MSQRDVEHAAARAPSADVRLDVSPYHPWLNARGIPPGCIEDWGIGTTNADTMRDRVVIPIHDANGQRVAHCGRYAADDVPNGEPRYKFDNGYKPELDLFGWHRVHVPHSVMLVDSFWSVITHGRRNRAVVSTMRNDISKEQIKLLTSAGVSRVGIVFGGTEAARNRAACIAASLASAGIWTKIATMPDDVQPYQVPFKETVVWMNGS